MASDLEPGMDVSSETEHQGVGRGDGGEPESDESVLRAKYADYCSAQLTEVFLSLDDERVYEIVQEEARAQAVGAADLGFKTKVRLATKRLRESVPLPDFETWRRDYETAPEKYDAYLMGLWQERPREDAGEAD